MTEMMSLINELWFLPRNLVSDGYDQALNRLSREVPMTIHEYPSGEPCWTWKVPEKWTCDEAFLEDMNGRRIIDVNDHPLHVVSYARNCFDIYIAIKPCRTRPRSSLSITIAIGGCACRNE